MQGTAAEPGIIPRSVDTVLKMIKDIEEKDKKAKSQALPYSVSVSYYEIYNEKLIDLLETKESDLPIREDINKNIVIPGLADVCNIYLSIVVTYLTLCRCLSTILSTSNRCTNKGVATDPPGPQNSTTNHRAVTLFWRSKCNALMATKRSPASCT